MIQKLCAYMACKNYAHRFLFISYTKNIYINCMHTLYENKNYVHKLFTNIYEKKLQSNNIKHRKSNKERKKRKSVPKPTLWLPRSLHNVATSVQQHRLGWMLCFCVHVEKGNGKIKISIRWASTCDMRARRTRSKMERQYGNQRSRVQMESRSPSIVKKFGRDISSILT